MIRDLNIANTRIERLSFVAPYIPVLFLDASSGKRMANRFIFRTTAKAVGSLG
jgi:hypothetical protein